MAPRDHDDPGHPTRRSYLIAQKLGTRDAAYPTCHDAAREEPARPGPSETSTRRLNFWMNARLSRGTRVKSRGSRVSHDCPTRSAFLLILCVVAQTGCGSPTGV